MLRSIADAPSIGTVLELVQLRSPESSIYNLAMDYFRRLEPTPTALRNGRVTLAIFGAFVIVLLALIVLVPGFGDTGMLAITATTGVALAGDAIAYLGQPTLTRYRLGLILTAVGVAASFYLLIANPFPSAAA